jgi:hypothetical protein
MPDAGSDTAAAEAGAAQPGNELMQQDEQATVGKLVLSAANRILREVVIDRKQLTIGRRPYNDLLLDDLTVSGEHAIVHTAGGESVIHDLKSRNGTLINGAPVMQQQLADGDCVDIGIYRLVYKVERIETGRSAAGFRPTFLPPLNSPVPTNLTGARTSAWLPSMRSKPAEPSKPINPAIAAFISPDDARSASLRFLGGHDAGRQMMLERPIVSIRNGNGQVAVVAKRLNGYFLTHVEGLAYPLVNGESIGLSAHVLRDNDLIELAGTIIQFSLDR